MSDEATCKGSYYLGTACGKCSKCDQERLGMSQAEQELSPDPDLTSDMEHILFSAANLQAVKLASIALEEAGVTAMGSGNKELVDKISRALDLVEEIAHDSIRYNKQLLGKK
jgi:hypothetical protein